LIVLIVCGGVPPDIAFGSWYETFGNSSQLSREASLAIEGSLLLEEGTIDRGYLLPEGDYMMMCLGEKRALASDEYRRRVPADQREGSVPLWASCIKGGIRGLPLNKPPPTTLVVIIYIGINH
jgi:hypothetical protein